MKDTTMGIPPVKLPGGGHIHVGRILRTLLGAAIILALIVGWVEAHDKIELGIEIGICFALFEVCSMVLVVSSHPDETFDHPLPARKLRRVTTGTTAQLFATAAGRSLGLPGTPDIPEPAIGAWGATV